MSEYRTTMIGPDQVVPVGRIEARPVKCERSTPCDGLAPVVAAHFIHGSEHIFYRCMKCGLRFSHHFTHRNPDQYQNNRGEIFIITTDKKSKKLDDVPEQGRKIF